MTRRRVNHPCAKRTSARGALRSSLSATLAFALMMILGVTSAGEAQASRCPPKSIGGPNVGYIQVDGTKVPLKQVRFEPGGELEPPATNQAAGFSTVNARIGAKSGTTVIAWHVRYGRGCPGTLNDLLSMPIGTTFQIAGRDTAPIELAITERYTVRKGRYRTSWFRPHGPYRVALFTCGGLRNNTFTRNVVVIAEPVTQLGAEKLQRVA